MECDRKGMIEPIGIYDYGKNPTGTEDMEDIHSKIDELVEAVYYLMSAKQKVYDEKTDMYSKDCIEWVNRNDPMPPEPNPEPDLERIKEQISVTAKYEPDYKKIVTEQAAILKLVKEIAIDRIWSPKESQELIAKYLEREGI